jgi:hypothetical protein
MTLIVHAVPFLYAHYICHYSYQLSIPYTMPHIIITITFMATI